MISDTGSAVQVDEEKIATNQFSTELIMASLLLCAAFIHQISYIISLWFLEICINWKKFVEATVTIFFPNKPPGVYWGGGGERRYTNLFYQQSNAISTGVIFGR